MRSRDNNEHLDHDDHQNGFPGVSGRGHRHGHRGPGRPGPGGRPGRPSRPEGHFGFGGHDGPPPWVARRMKRGDIRTAVLAALQDGPGHGYELMSRLSERTGGRWRPSPGSVYPMLQALQDEGLVTSTETDGKRVFELTPEGQAEATERASAGGNSWEMGTDDEHQKLRASVMQLMAAARQVGMSGNPELLQKAEVIVTEARRKVYQLLAES